MKETNLKTLARLRFLVGYLGEKARFGWWPTSFFGEVGEQFMAPVFPRSILLAQYHGAAEAARKLHDQHIGVGRVFHLFRLPEEIEQDLHRLIQNEPQFINSDLFNRKEAAEVELRRIADNPETETPVGESATSCSIPDTCPSWTSSMAFSGYTPHRGEKAGTLSEGPVALGKASALLKKESISSMAQMYAGAFHQGKRSYPYFSFQS